jgi:hypothetical protein
VPCKGAVAGGIEALCAYIRARTRCHPLLHLLSIALAKTVTTFVLACGMVDIPKITEVAGNTISRSTNVDEAADRAAMFMFHILGIASKSPLRRTA